MHAHPRLQHLFATVFALAIGPCAAQVIPVSGGGSALATAVALAPSGAILELAPGSYTGFTIALTKDITIVAPQQATIVGTIDTLTGSVQNTLRLDGLTFQQSAPGVGGEVWTTGNLFLEQCTCFGVYVSAATTHRRVQIHGCTITANNGNGFYDVDAVIQDSTLQGGFCGYGFWLRGTLRAERVVAAGSACPWGPVSGAGIEGTATAAQCQFIGHPSIIYGGGYWTVDNTPANGLTVDASVGWTRNPVNVRPLATATWTTRNWTIGGTSTISYRETQNKLVAVVLALDFVPWISPLAAEPLFVGATPDWAVVGVGVTNAQGTFTHSFPIPNAAALRYSSAWLTGAFVDPLPLRTTAPLGGLIL